MKRLPGNWNAAPKDFQGVVKEWFQRGRRQGTIMTDNFLVTLNDFYAAWKNIRYENINPKQIYEHTKEESPPEQLLRDHPGYYELHRLCTWLRGLQKAHSLYGTTPYISCRLIAEIMGVNKDTANTYFNILAHEEYIRITKKGRMTWEGGIASRYEYFEI